VSERPLAVVLRLTREGRHREALDALDALSKSHAECPYLLNLRAVLLQAWYFADHQDPIAEVEADLLASYELDQGNIDTLYGLACFYDSLKPDHEKALFFAERCATKASRRLEEMRTTISGDVDRIASEILSRPHEK